MNQAKLAKLQAQVRVGGKGTPRRKKGAASKGPQSNDKEIMNEMRKQQLRQLGYVEEANIFKKSDETVIHFPRPAVYANVRGNTFLIKGNYVEKPILELGTSILPQLSQAKAQALATSLQAQLPPGSLPAGAFGGAAGAEDDADIPDLVEGAKFGEGEGDDDDVPELVESK